jgi:hypothetical protein
MSKANTAFTVPLRIEQEADGSCWYLRWNFDNRQVSPSELANLNVTAPAGTELAMLSGRGPLWLYSALALSVAEQGLEVAVRYPQADGYVLVNSDSTDRPIGSILDSSGLMTKTAEEKACPTLKAMDRTAGLAIESESRTTQRLDPSITGGVEQRVASLLKRIGEQRLIYWDGQAPVWFAAALALAVARQSEKAAIGINTPIHGGPVVIRGDAQGWYQPGVVLPDSDDADGPPDIWGVVGDPNRGKSVFSWKLYRALQRRGCRAYRFDCDVAAPTADWGLRGRTGPALRQAQKVNWHDAFDVPMLERAIEGLARSSLEVILIDLPGGNHDASPVQRIPLDREPLFSCVDRYFVLQGEPTETLAWKRALRGANGKAVIDAEVLSRLAPAEQDEPAMLDDNPAVFRPGALHREAVDRLDPAIESLADQIVSQS